MILAAAIKYHIKKQGKMSSYVVQDMGIFLPS